MKLFFTRSFFICLLCFFASLFPSHRVEGRETLYLKSFFLADRQNILFQDLFLDKEPIDKKSGFSFWNDIYLATPKEKITLSEAEIYRDIKKKTNVDIEIQTETGFIEIVPSYTMIYAQELIQAMKTEILKSFPEYTYSMLEIVPVKPLKNIETTSGALKMKVILSKRKPLHLFRASVQIIQDDQVIFSQEVQFECKWNIPIYRLRADLPADTILEEKHIYLDNYEVEGVPESHYIVDKSNILHKKIKKNQKKGYSLKKEDIYSYI